MTIFTSTTNHQSENPVPPTRDLRDQIRIAVGQHVQATRLEGPLSMAELKNHGLTLLKQAQIPVYYLNFTSVLLNNQLWQTTVAAVPYHRRLLLLPQCFRNQLNCQSSLDELGRICEQCGKCLIGQLLDEADGLGYAVLVAEGTQVVAGLLESGKIEAVIGVGCMEVLEKIFPYAEAASIPSIAIPLLHNGCVDSKVDFDWIRNALHEHSRDRPPEINLPRLRRQTQSWFTPAALQELIEPGPEETEQLGFSWLAQAGKRWRALLLNCAYQALASNHKSIPEDVRRAAIAIECFHKASLIHDDIEDADKKRYDRETLHMTHGVATALNVGDYLLGQGYRILAELSLPKRIRIKMLATAAQAHITLCRGQGSELAWRRQPGPMTVDQVIEIFRRKTAPGFAVALSLGSAAAEAGDKIERVIASYSQALGVAYQINDDLADEQWLGSNPSIMLALAYQMADRKQQIQLNQICRLAQQGEIRSINSQSIIDQLQLRSAAGQLRDKYRDQALHVLHDLSRKEFKRLLRKLVNIILA